MTDGPFNGMSERKERRAARRASYDAAVSCEIQGISILDYTANLSAGGVYIRTTKINAPIGAPVLVTLRVPGMTTKSQLEGKVVRTDQDEDGAGIAIRFDFIPAMVGVAIARLVDSP